MKFIIKIVSVIGFMSISQLAYPADITDTYTAGDPLTTTTLDNIKSAVNSKQDRVTGICPPGESIGAINADGTVTCEVDTLSALSCATDEFAKFDGSIWVCSGTTLKTLSLNVYAMQPTAGTLLERDGMRLPEASIVPQLDMNFTLPSDYVDGTDFIIRVSWRSFGAVGTAGVLNNFGRMWRTGDTQFNFSGANSTALDTGSDPLGTTFTNDITVTSTAFQAGDHIVYGIFRNSNSATLDSSTADIIVMGALLEYTATE